jgi:hypothetical protein
MFRRSGYFAMLDLKVCNALVSRYAWLLYVLGCLFVNRQNHPYKTYSISDLMALLDVPSSYNTGRLRRQILEPAIAEINKLSPYFTMSLKEGKRGVHRRISGFQLIATKRKERERNEYRAKLHEAPSPAEDWPSHGEERAVAVAEAVTINAPAPPEPQKQRKVEEPALNASADVRWPSDGKLEQARDVALYQLCVKIAPGFDVNDLAERFRKHAGDLSAAHGPNLVKRWEAFVRKHASQNSPSKSSSAAIEVPEPPPHECSTMSIYREAIKAQIKAEVYLVLMYDALIQLKQRGGENILVLNICSTSEDLIRGRYSYLFNLVAGILFKVNDSLYGVSVQCDGQIHFAQRRDGVEFLITNEEHCRYLFDDYDENFHETGCTNQS